MVVGEFTLETDVLVIGGGPGGYSTAFRAAELGLQTAIVDEREALGGICLHAGCVPSKTLLHAAETIQLAAGAAQFGVHYPPPRVNREELLAWVNRCIGQLAAALQRTAGRLGVEIVRGRARFESAREVAVPGAATPHIHFRRAVVATGSRPRENPALPFDGHWILSPAEAVLIPRAARNVLLVGSGYMAVELATIYAALGAAVTMVTSLGQALPDADDDLERPLARRLQRMLAALATSTTIAEAKSTDDGVQVRFAGATAPPASTFDMVIVAEGMLGNTAGLALDRVDIAPDAAGCIAVDEQLRTGNARIMAVGDVTGDPRLADRALHQGRVAAEVLAGWGTAFDARCVPMVAFTDPQIAWCGLTEKSAAAAGVACAVQKIPWGASGRAVGLGRAEGMTKIVYDPATSLVLGVGLVGPGAAEMISEAALAIEMGAELADLAHTIHPHPTMSELMSDAARVAADKSNAGSEH